MKNSKAKNITVKWKRVPHVTGYQVRITTNKTGTQNNKTVTISNSVTVKTIIQTKK